MFVLMVALFLAVTVCYCNHQGSDWWLGFGLEDGVKVDMFLRNC